MTVAENVYNLLNFGVYFSVDIIILEATGKVDCVEN